MPTHVESVHRSLTVWLHDKDVDAKAALLVTTGELVMLHLVLSIYVSGTDPIRLDDGKVSALDTVHAKVVKILAHGGYEEPK